MIDTQKHLLAFSRGFIWDQQHYQVKGKPQAAPLTRVLAPGKLRIASPAPIMLEDANPEFSSQSSPLFHVATSLIWELLFFCHSACIVSCKHTFNY